MTDLGTTILNIEAGIDRCATIVADTMTEREPGLNHDRIRRAVSKELWMALDEVSEFVARGAVV